MGCYVERVNTSPKQKKIKIALEGLGHTNVEVWWENLGIDMDMGGQEGGYMFHSDQEDLYPLGHSLNETIEHIKNAPWLKIDSWKYK